MQEEVKGATEEIWRDMLWDLRREGRSISMGENYYDPITTYDDTSGMIIPKSNYGLCFLVLFDWYLFLFFSFSLLVCPCFSDSLIWRRWCVRINRWYINLPQINKDINYWDFIRFYFSLWNGRYVYDNVTCDCSACISSTGLLSTKLFSMWWRLSPARSRLNASISTSNVWIITYVHKSITIRCPMHECPNLPPHILQLYLHMRPSDQTT